MDLGATLFPRSAPWSPEYCEDGDGHQNLMQLTWAPGFDQSRPDGVDLRIDAWIAGRDNVREFSDRALAHECRVGRSSTVIPLRSLQGGQALPQCGNGRRQVVTPRDQGTSWD